MNGCWVCNVVHRVEVDHEWVCNVALVSMCFILQQLSGHLLPPPLHSRLSANVSLQRYLRPPRCRCSMPGCLRPPKCRCIVPGYLRPPRCRCIVPGYFRPPRCRCSMPGRRHPQVQVQHAKVPQAPQVQVHHANRHEGEDEVQQYGRSHITPTPLQARPAQPNPSEPQPHTHRGRDLVRDNALHAKTATN